MSYLNQAKRHVAAIVAIGNRDLDAADALTIDIRDRFSSRADHCGNGCPVWRIYDHGVYVDTCWTKSGAEYRTQMLNSGALVIDPCATVSLRAVAA